MHFHMCIIWSLWLMISNSMECLGDQGLFKSGNLNYSGNICLFFFLKMYANFFYVLLSRIKICKKGKFWNSRGNAQFLSLGTLEGVPLYLLQNLLSFPREIWSCAKCGEVIPNISKKTQHFPLEFLTEFLDSWCPERVIFKLIVICKHIACTW